MKAVALIVAQPPESVVQKRNANIMRTIVGVRHLSSSSAHPSAVRGCRLCGGRASRCTCIRTPVESSLHTIAGAAAGSIVAFDYFSAELIESNSFFMRYARAMMRRTGEPWHFGIDNTPPAKQRAAEFLERCGLVLEEQRNFGPETKWMRAMAGFAIAIVPSTAALWNSQSVVTR